MANRKPCLSLKPQNVSDSLWYYEERKGLCIVNRNRVAPGHDATIDYLPWRLVCSSVARYKATQRAKEKTKTKRN